MEPRLVLLGSECLLRSTAVTSRQCPPGPGYQREGGELRVGRKEKGHLLTNIYFRTPALKLLQSLACFLVFVVGSQRVTCQCQDSKFWKKEVPIGLQWRTILQAECKPRAKCKSKPRTALRYNYIYIYICIFIYMLCTKDWDIRHH